MTDTTDILAATTNPATDNSKRNSLIVGAFLGLVGVSCYSLVTLFGVITTAAPYIAGVGMFVGLFAIFAAIIATLKQVRKTAQKEVAIWDCYVAVAVIGVMGYFLAACVATFQPGANPSEFWTNGATAAAIFAMLFGGGKYAAELFNAGKSSQ